MYQGTLEHLSSQLRLEVNASVSQAVSKDVINETVDHVAQPTYGGLPTVSHDTAQENAIQMVPEPEETQAVRTSPNGEQHGDDDEEYLALGPASDSLDI